MFHLYFYTSIHCHLDTPELSKQLIRIMPNIQESRDDSGVEGRAEAGLAKGLSVCPGNYWEGGGWWFAVNSNYSP